jgi:hypothetical protein
LTCPLFRVAVSVGGIQQPTSMPVGQQHQPDSSTVQCAPLPLSLSHTHTVTHHPVPCFVLTVHVLPPPGMILLDTGSNTGGLCCRLQGLKEAQRRVCGLKLLVYAALSYWCNCLKLLVYSALSY